MTMKKGELKQLSLKTNQELKALLKEARTALFKAKMEFFQNKLKNKRFLGSKKREIAQILTKLRLQEMVKKEDKNV